MQFHKDFGQVAAPRKRLWDDASFSQELREH